MKGNTRVMRVDFIGRSESDGLVSVFYFVQRLYGEAVRYQMDVVRRKELLLGYAGMMDSPSWEVSGESAKIETLGDTLRCVQESNRLAGMQSFSLQARMVRLNGKWVVFVTTNMDAGVGMTINLACDYPTDVQFGTDAELVGHEMAVLSGDFSDILIKAVEYMGDVAVFGSSDPVVAQSVRDVVECPVLSMEPVGVDGDERAALVLASMRVEDMQFRSLFSAFSRLRTNPDVLRQVYAEFGEKYPSDLSGEEIIPIRDWSRPPHFCEYDVEDVVKRLEEIEREHAQGK